MLSILFLLFQCVGSGCPGSSGGSTPTTIPSVYKSITNPTLGNFIGTSTATITNCASKLCLCTWQISTVTGAGNGKLSVTYIDATLNGTITSGALNGNQAFADGHTAMYTMLLNSTSTAPTWTVLNVSSSDTFSITVGCSVLN